MSLSLRRPTLIVLMACVIWPTWVNAQAEELRVIARDNLWAMPYNVEIREAASGISVSGRLLKSAANPSRRFHGKVYLEMLDKNGVVIAVQQAKPQRVGLAKHSQRARFEIEVESVPDEVTALRVSYR